MVEKRLVACVVGTGFGQYHIERLGELANVELRSIVFNSDRRKAEELARRRGVFQVTDSVADVLTGGVDLLVVGSPVYRHVEHIEAALGCGYMVVSEKPLALDDDGTAVRHAEVQRTQASPTW